GLVGHCVNMLPLRTRVNPEAAVAQLVAEVRTTLLDGQAHQLFTMGQLLQKLPIARDPSRLPLVTVIFNLDRGLSPEAMPFEGLAPALEGNPRRYELYDLFLNVVELGGQAKLECQFNSDLFDVETVRRWLDAYRLLLTSMAEALEKGEGTVASLRLVSDAELESLARWNGESALDVDPSLTVVDLLEAQLAKSPDAIAVESEGRKYTYAELHARADAIAAKLRELGAGKGTLVGICLERGVDLVAAVVGALKSGAGYVPLDPGYPPDRLAFMVDDAKIAVLLTEKRVTDDFTLPAKHTLLLEDVPASAPRAPHGAGPEDVCYVIFTSGSTGRPKGVLLPHRATVNLLKSVQKTPGMTAADTVLAVTTLSFDIAVSEVLLPLTVGARIAMVSREVAADGPRLLEALKAYRANFLDATPSTWRLLLAAGWQGDGLTKGICTGEAMPRDLAIELVKRLPSVWNGYGPTETTVWSTFYEVKEPVGRLLIGRPVANTQCHVWDARRQPVLPGVVGELYIGGRGVALGYLNRPDLTAERFRDGVYKTGDLVRLLPDGNLECLGRNDFQVKLRGFRIELGEIEDALTQHPAVRQAAVTVRELRPGEPALLGYYTEKEGQTVTDLHLRGHLRKTLPEYMVPQVLTKLEALPLSPAGKIDRKALPSPEHVEREDVGVPPQTDNEKLVAEVWGQVLGMSRFSLDDNFFNLGGHSLIAFKVIAELEKRVGKRIGPRTLMLGTLRQVAHELSTASAPAPSAPRPVPSESRGLRERLLGRVKKLVKR
ncbi:MAG: amino acid adenylation domain-containing protein, partial [Myxococcaceae bacterium]|nr:amino acid adenylation domain-containing protein [Myxococcaceae bacterium]